MAIGPYDGRVRNALRCLKLTDLAFYDKLRQPIPLHFGHIGIGLEAFLCTPRAVRSLAHVLDVMGSPGPGS
eukprot:8860150-Prorocentrum_lima.AAC.1